MQFFTKVGYCVLATAASGSVVAANSVQPIFERLTTPSNWQWQTFNNLPKTKTYAQGVKQDRNNVSRYYLERELAGYRNSLVTAYGNKTAPNEVVFYSGGWGTTNKAALVKLSDVVNPANLKSIKSNCNFGRIEDRYAGKDKAGKYFSGMNYIDSQTIYQWTRGNAKPLYVVAMTGGGLLKTNVSKQGVNSTVIVVPQLANLNNAIALHGWNKDKNGNRVTCRFN